MTVKLTPDELKALHLVLNASLLLVKPVRNVQASLFHELCDALCDRMRAKLKKHEIDPRKKCNMSVNSIEAKAFYCWYRSVRDGLSAPYHYECLVADNFRNQIALHYDLIH